MMKQKREREVIHILSPHKKDNSLEYTIINVKNFYALRFSWSLPKGNCNCAVIFYAFRHCWLFIFVQKMNFIWNEQFLCYFFKSLIQNRNTLKVIQKFMNMGLIWVTTLIMLKNCDSFISVLLLQNDNEIFMVSMI